MNKLPKIFQNSNNCITNNKKIFVSFNNNIMDYFNKQIIVNLNDGKVFKGVLESKESDYILLDTGDYIRIKDILKITLN